MAMDGPSVIGPDCESCQTTGSRSTRMRGQRAWLFKRAFFCLAGLSWAMCHQAHAQTFCADAERVDILVRSWLPSPDKSHGLSPGPVGHRPDSDANVRNHRKPEDLDNRDHVFTGHGPAGPGLCLWAGGRAHDPGTGRAVHALDDDALDWVWAQVSSAASGPMASRPSGTASRGRTAGHAAETRVTAAHTRNSNIPGGLAARYFNRGTTTATGSRSQPYYNRQMRQFPQTGQ